VAWVDYHGYLHMADLVTGTQHVVTRIMAQASVQLTQAGGHLYWVDAGGSYVPALGGMYLPPNGHQSPVIRELDLATGRISVAGPGESVFAAADGRHVFIARTDTSLYEVPVTGAPGAPRLHRLPPGWFMPAGDARAVGNEILVQSVYPLAGVRLPHKSHTLAVWNPQTGQVKTIIKGYWALDALGPAHEHGGLLAWLPISCGLGQNCRMRITSLQALSTRGVPSPLGRGFADAAAFSPDGRWLAVFVNQQPTRTVNGLPGPAGTPQPAMIPDTAQLALIDTRTGAMRRIPGTTTMTVGPLLAWARWLPDGRHLLVGGNDASYLVDASAMTAKPVYFLPSRDHGHHRVQQTGDLNVSAVIIPPSPVTAAVTHQ
jgi:hypothetical protein